MLSSGSESVEDRKGLLSRLMVIIILIPNEIPEYRFFGRLLSVLQGCVGFG